MPIGLGVGRKGAKIPPQGSCDAKCGFLGYQTLFFFWKVLIFHQPWWGFPFTVPPCDLIHDETFYPLTSTDRHAAKWASLVGLRIKQQGPCSNPFGLFLSKIFKQGMFEKNEFPFRSLKEKSTCSKCFSTGEKVSSALILAPGAWNSLVQGQMALHSQTCP